MNKEKLRSLRREVREIEERIYREGDKNGVSY